MRYFQFYRVPKPFTFARRPSVQEGILERMKPLHIALLLAAGAGAGALVMMVAQHQPHNAPMPPVAQAPVPVPEPPRQAAVPAGAQAMAPAPFLPEPATKTPDPVVKAEAAHEVPRPSPWEAPKPGRVHSRAGSNPDPRQQAAVVRQTPPPPVAAAPPAAAAEPLREPPSQPIAAPQNPPARVETPEPVAPPQPPPPPELAKVTLNAGTLLSVRLVDGLNAERNAPGDVFAGTLDRELVADGFVIAERGARVDGRVTTSNLGGRVKGVSSLAVELTRLRTSDGQTVALHTDPFERRAEPTHGEDAAKVGVGAALGAVIGAAAGGGKGAAIGAGAGGAAGAGTVLATRGKPASLPSETRITFRLSAPVTLTERR